VRTYYYGFSIGVFYLF